MALARLVKLLPICPIPVASGEPLQSLLSVFEIHQRFCQLLTAGLQGGQFSAERVDPVDQILVCAARPVGRRSDQLAELALDGLRQRAPPTASQDSADFRFQSAVKA